MLKQNNKQHSLNKRKGVNIIMEKTIKKINLIKQKYGKFDSMVEEARKVYTPDCVVGYRYLDNCSSEQQNIISEFNAKSYTLQDDYIIGLCRTDERFKTVKEMNKDIAIQIEICILKAEEVLNIRLNDKEASSLFEAAYRDSVYSINSKTFKNVKNSIIISLCNYKLNKKQKNVESNLANNQQAF